MPRPQNATLAAAVASILFSALFFVVFCLMWLPVAADPLERLRGGEPHVALAMILLRFSDLKKRGIVHSWPQLRRLQQLHKFPLGRMLSPNVRAWSESEINDWIKSRPIENARPLQGATKAKRERRQAMLSEGKGA